MQNKVEWMDIVRINDEYYLERFDVEFEDKRLNRYKFGNDMVSIEKKLEKIEENYKEKQDSNKDMLEEELDNVAGGVEIIDGEIKELQKIATDFTDNNKVDVVFIGNNDGKIVGAATKDSGVQVNAIIKEAASVLGGGGGGRPNLAQGAGPNADKMQLIFNTSLSKVRFSGSLIADWRLSTS